jgi:hypothetical protein
VIFIPYSLVGLTLVQCCLPYFVHNRPPLIAASLGTVWFNGLATPYSFSWYVFYQPTFTFLSLWCVIFNTIYYKYLIHIFLLLQDGDLLRKTSVRAFHPDITTSTVNGKLYSCILKYVFFTIVVLCVRNGSDISVTLPLFIHPICFGRQNAKDEYMAT